MQLHYVECGTRGAVSWDAVSASPPKPSLCVRVCCRLSGSISRDVALLTYLSHLKLSNNRLNGSLEDGLWTLPQLQNVDLSNNSFEGTIARLTG